MKKILFIFPILAIILTGCTFPKSVTTKTYTNNRYEYSIQYPSNWFIDGTESAENDFRQVGDYYIGGELNFFL